MKNIVIIGAGAMGSAFSIPCIDNDNKVSLIGTHLEDNLIETIKSNHKLHPKLNINLPLKLNIEKIDKLEDLMKEKPDILVVGVSSVGIDWFVNQVAEKLESKTSIVLLTKGLSIVNRKLSTLSDKIKKLLNDKGINSINISAIKGPCLAAGLANKIRTSTLIASNDIVQAKNLQKIITTNYYSTETSEDLNGVELCGAIKNIYSMLIGASEGLSSQSKDNKIKSKYFHNTAASLIHKSVSEMSKFVKHYGGKQDTVYGLAGLGDLYVSAIGGRNSQMGKYLGEGYLYKDAKEKFMNEVTVEGAELAIEVGPIIKENLNKKDFPLMMSIIDCICDNKKLEISW
tara:strand:- start:1373 stop:2401 length:1029 start_codon:yes stop_codon:yes gene_type:complete